MSSQKIGPSSLASRARLCAGAVESSDSMLPTTGLVGGCGIGFNLFVDAIAQSSPAVSPHNGRHPEERALARVSKDETLAFCLPSFEARLIGSHLRMTFTRTAFCAIQSAWH